MADVASRWIRRFSLKNVFKLVQAPVIEPRAKLLSRRRPRSSKKLMCITSWLNFFTFICGRSSLLRFVQTMLKICCNRQFSFCREIGNFLSLHWCSQLYQTQTAASSLNRPSPCSLTTTARLNLPLFFFFFLKWANPGLFCLFSFFSRYNFNTNWKKRRWCAWDSNPGPQDGRRRRNHGAMAATHKPTSPKKSRNFPFYDTYYDCS